MDDELNWQQQAEAVQTMLESALAHQQDLETRIEDLKRELLKTEFAQQDALLTLGEYHGQQLDRLNDRIHQLNATIAQRDQVIAQQQQEIAQLKQTLQIQQKLLQQRR
jgi:hypothetical protein